MIWWPPWDSWDPNPVWWGASIVLTVALAVFLVALVFMVVEWLRG